VQVLVDCHRRGVAHCDLKPDNIMNSVDKTRVVLVDFGSACVRNGAHSCTSILCLTISGSLGLIRGISSCTVIASCSILPLVFKFTHVLVLYGVMGFPYHVN
jgi:serine/threonine protein kinase